MTTSILPILPSLENHYTIPDTGTEKRQNYRSQYCTLQWRRNQLLVKSSGKLQQPYFPPLDNAELLVECLKHSLVNLVRIDPKLDESDLQFWAEACWEANKPIFINLTLNRRTTKQPNQFLKISRRLLDFILGLVLLFLSSPLILGLAILLQLNSPEILFESEWYVGERGKLFRVRKFCTSEHNHISPLGLFMRKYNLDNLPKLLNVIRGEMSLIGFHCWCLSDALKLNLLEQI
jgi:hypothetical protein